MAEPLSGELEQIQREQKELRQRLLALERRIESLAFQLTPQAQPETSSPADSLEEALIQEPPPPPLVEPVVSTPVLNPPRTNLEEKAASEKSSWEFKLGTVWLVRIGIVILLTGLVFLGNYAYHHIVPRIGPWVKLALLYFLGGTLAWIGARLEKSAESLRNYGRVILAGGAAMIYYTTYGATFVDKLKVIGSPLAGGLLLLAVGAVVVWLAEKRQAESVALTTIVLSYYTAAINPIGLFSLYSSLLLTLAAIWFLLRHRWTTISFFSLIGTYGSYAFWRFYRHEEFISFGERVPDHAWQGAAFLLCYWALFTAAVFLSRASQFAPEKRTLFLTVNNAAFFGLVFQIVHANHPGWTGRFSLIFGAVLLALAWLAKRRESEDLFLDGAYLVQGLGVLTFGLLTELSVYQLSLALAIQGTLMLFSINRRHGWIYETGAALVTLIAFATSLELNLLARPEPVLWSLTGLFIADAWLVKNYKKRADNAGFNWMSAAYCLLVICEIARLLLSFFPIWTAQGNFPLAALMLIILAMAIRLRELAITGQILALLSAASYILFSVQDPDARFAPFAIIFVPFLLVHWWQWQKERDPGSFGQTLFSALFLLAASRWIHGHCLQTHFGFYISCLALAAVIYGSLTRALPMALLGQILVFVSAILFFFDSLVLNVPPSWLHVISLLFYLTNERLIKSGKSCTAFPRGVQIGLIVIAITGFWLEWNRWIDFNHSPFPKTLAWALLGTAALCGGLVVRERTYRICGLVLLGMATLRIFITDIWGLDPIFRILSFIVLGVVLLSLGFIYNKFADKLREWL